MKLKNKCIGVYIFCESINGTCIPSDNIQIHVRLDLLFVCLFLSQSTMTSNNVDIHIYVKR